MAAGKPTGKRVQLSERLRMLAELVTPGNRVADVGCDHGFLSIYLVREKISPHVIASDVRKGPLAAARKHVAEQGLEQYIEVRLSDGLMAYEPGEAQTLVCAGMGGRLMQQILTQSREVTAAFGELILQPQSELRQFREFLREQKLKIVKERILCEEGKYYFAFLVKHGNEESREGYPGTLGRLYDKYGEQLLEEKNPVLKEYLEKSLLSSRRVQGEILAHRGEGTNPRLEESLAEIEEEIQDLESALALY